MYDKILVPLDGSSDAEMAIPYAEEVAAKLGSQMILISASESGPTDTERFYQTYLKRITEQVQHQLTGWKPKKEISVQSKVLPGQPANEILHYADVSDVGLIAMTSRGSSGSGPWALGSTAAKVLQITTKPLLLVRSPASDAALQQKKLIKRILVPLDGSRLGEAAIPYAEGLGQALGAELVLFHAVEPEPLTPYSLWENAMPPSTDEIQGHKKNYATYYLEEAAKLVKDKGIGVSVAVDSGHAAECIIDYARENRIDLIALSTHGRTGLELWVFGSVTNKVLHYGDTPVLVVRPPVV
jgi:nucleotide-binding universal stress UspA family protein